MWRITSHRTRVSISATGWRNLRVRISWWALRGDHGQAANEKSAFSAGDNEDGQDREPYNECRARNRHQLGIVFDRLKLAVSPLTNSVFQDLVVIRIA